MEPMYQGESLWPPMKAVTQQEFENLTDDQKSQGVYAVMEDGVDMAGQSDIYSNEETVVGRWIDGKPIYRRVVDITTPNKTGSTSPIYTDNSLDTVITAIGWINRNNNQDLCQYFPSFQTALAYNKSTKNVMIYLSATNDINCSGVLILEYTKTTD